MRGCVACMYVCVDTYVNAMLYVYWDLRGRFACSSDPSSPPPAAAVAAAALTRDRVLSLVVSAPPTLGSVVSVVDGAG